VASAASELRRPRRVVSRYSASGYTFWEGNAWDGVLDAGVGGVDIEDEEADVWKGGLNTRPSSPLNTARYIC
jgi:hypothetical protein